MPLAASTEAQLPDGVTQKVNRPYARDQRDIVPVTNHDDRSSEIYHGHGMRGQCS